VHIFSENWQTTIACNNADGAQVTFVTPVTMPSQSNHSQPSDLLQWVLLENHPRLFVHDLWPSILAKNPRPHVFSPSLCGFLADAALQKTCVFGSSTHVAVLWIQAAGGGHFRSRIAGEWFPSEHPIGDFK
jgi:hypothetical protein